MAKKGGKSDAGPMLQYGQKAVDLQSKQYEEGKQYAQPYYEAGKTGLNELMTRLGLAGDSTSSNYGALLKNYSGQDLYNDPSYSFRFGQGQKAAERALAAQGIYLAPAGIQALQDYGQGMASQEYQNAYNRHNQDQGNIYNRLANIAGLGQTAGAQNQAAGAAYGQNVGDIYQGMGNAIASAQQAARANRQSMFNTLIGAGTTAAVFSDPALKENIKLLGEENGHNIYEFTYRDDKAKRRYIGVMADEVQKSNPGAVTIIDGYLAVDYNKIGVQFREA